MLIEFPDLELALRVDEGRLLSPSAAAPYVNLTDLSTGLLKALDEPVGFPALRRALTPDDRITVIVDDSLGHVGELLGTLAAYLLESGIPPSNVTLVSPAGSTQPWVDELPDALLDVQTEIHDPSNPKHLAYLATTAGGRRVYLNRTLVDSDQSILLGASRYDSSGRAIHPIRMLFPALSNASTIAELGKKSGGTQHEEAAEVAWLLGAPFVISAIPGSGDGFAQFIGGTVDAADQVIAALNARWRQGFPSTAQTVVAAVGQKDTPLEFAVLAGAAKRASQLVESGGRLVLLAHSSSPIEIPTHESLRADSADAALSVVATSSVVPAGLRDWLEVVSTVRVNVLGLSEESAEDLFAASIETGKQIQKVLDASAAIAVLRDADRVLVSVT